MFKANILGRIGRDAQVFEAANGTKFVGFTVAVNTKSKNGEITYWVDVRSFNANHIKLAQYLTKGKLIQAGGDFNTGTMVDKTKTVRVTHSMLADYINFVNIGGQSNNTNKESVNNATPEKQVNEPVVKQVETSKKSDDDVVIVMNNPTVEMVPVTVGATNSADDDDLPF